MYVWKVQFNLMIKTHFIDKLPAVDWLERERKSNYLLNSNIKYIKSAPIDYPTQRHWICVSVNPTVIWSYSEIEHKSSPWNSVRYVRSPTLFFCLLFSNPCIVYNAHRNQCTLNGWINGLLLSINQWMYIGAFADVQNKINKQRF